MGIVLIDGNQLLFSITSLSYTSIITYFGAKVKNYFYFLYLISLLLGISVLLNSCGSWANCGYYNIVAYFRINLILTNPLKFCGEILEVELNAQTT